MNKVQLEEELVQLAAALSLIDEAKDAFIAIGDMMRPEGVEGDEQLNLVHRSQAAAIFCFFGNALEGPVRAVGDIKDRMERVAMGRGAA